MQIKLLFIHQIIELKSEVTKCCENVQHRNLHALLKERYTGSWFSTVSPHYSQIPYLWICLFATPKSILAGLLQSCVDMHRRWQIWATQCIHFQLWGNNVMFCLVSALSLQISVLCAVYLMPCFSYFCAPFWVILLFNMALEDSAEVLLSRVPKCKKAAMDLLEKNMC